LGFTKSSIISNGLRRPAAPPPEPQQHHRCRQRYQSMLDMDAGGTRLEAREESGQRTGRNKEVGGRDGQQGEPQHDGNELHRRSFPRIAIQCAIVAVKTETEIIPLREVSMPQARRTSSICFGGRTQVLRYKSSDVLRHKSPGFLRGKPVMHHAAARIVARHDLQRAGLWHDMTKF
jgi:hypothetical protein